MPMGRLAPGGQVWQASGESTPSAPLPEKFVSPMQPPSPLVTPYVAAHLVAGDIRRAPIVDRRPRRGGMRYLYSRGGTVMPIQAATAHAGVSVNESNFQQVDMGPIRNGGFNDALFQAGYPGFNLGLSFKVPTVTRPVNAPGAGMLMRSSVQVNRNMVNPYQRSSGAPGRTS